LEEWHHRCILLGLEEECHCQLRGGPPCTRERKRHHRTRDKEGCRRVQEKGTQGKEGGAARGGDGWSMRDKSRKP